MCVQTLTKSYMCVCLFFYLYNVCVSYYLCLGEGRQRYISNI